MIHPFRGEVAEHHRQREEISCLFSYLAGFRNLGAFASLKLADFLPLMILPAWSVMMGHTDADLSWSPVSFCQTFVDNCTADSLFLERKSRIVCGRKLPTHHIALHHTKGSDGA